MPSIPSVNSRLVAITTGLTRSGKRLTGWSVWVDDRRGALPELVTQEWRGSAEERRTRVPAEFDNEEDVPSADARAQIRKITM
jgi:hypothetical protein